MNRSFQLRLLPTAKQRSALEYILADSCETYNAALQERIEAWKLQRKSIWYFDQCRELTQLRQDPQFATIAIDIQREPLRRVEGAFKAFFRRCKTGGKPGFPRFRSRRRYSSFSWRNDNSVRESSILIPRLGLVRSKSHRQIVGTPKLIYVKRIGNKWVCRILCDVGEAPEKQPVCRSVGIDLGLTTFATMSDGSEVTNPRFVDKHAKRIARVQKSFSRKKRGSKNRIRAKETVRRAYQRLVDARKNFCHHVSKDLLNQYDLIAHEALKISNMARGHFAKSIMGAAWGQLLFQLAYKAESAGKYVVAVNPYNTSQVCSGCGVIVRKKLSERQHVCICGTELGRDHNAALNILSLGRRLAVAPATSEGAIRPLPTQG